MTRPLSPQLLSRREAIARIAAAVLATGTFTGETPEGKAACRRFSDADRRLLDEIGETILPATETPGAKAAGIGAFMAMMVEETYEPADQDIFVAGLAAIEADARRRFEASFVDATADQRLEILSAAEAECRRVRGTTRESRPTHYFSMMRDLTVLGFFTSEIGGTRVVHYIEVPGEYKPDIPYKKGDLVWY
jgi:Gluconate 2-dehydrogenase subunit 3